MATGDTQPEHVNWTVEKVEVHLPSFSTTNPELFFARAEISFSAAGVTSDATKFIHACQALDNKSAEVVRDIFMKPPTKDRYQYLKTELIRRLASSQEQRMRQLLETEEIGDGSPVNFSDTYVIWQETTLLTRCSGCCGWEGYHTKHR